MLDGTQLKRHFSDIVSASATKSGSDVELIDPFQLINWRDKTPPDHLYPKFKLFLEEFKKGIFTDIPRITYEGPDDPDVQKVPEQDIQDHETVEQKLQTAKEKESPSGIDMVLKKLMDTTMTPDPLDVPDSFANSKRPRNKRKNKETKEPSKPQYHIPKQAPKESKRSKDHNKEEDVEIKPKIKRQKRENKKSQEQQYHPPQQVPEELELPMEQVNEADVENIEESNNVSQVENTTNQLRRSRRLPRASAKYLESIRAELQDSDTE